MKTYSKTWQAVQSYKLLLSLIFMMFVSMVGLVVFEAIESRKAELKRAELESKNLAITIDRYSRATFAKVDLALLQLQSLLTDLAVGKKVSREELYHLLTAVHANIPEIGVIAVTNKEGVYIADSILKPEDLAKKIPLLSNGDRDYFIQLKNSKSRELLISEPLIGRTTKLPSIILSRAISDRNRNFTGIVFASITLNTFSQFFSKLYPGDDGVVALFNMNRILLARLPFISDDIGRRFPISAELKKAFETDKYQGVYTAVSVVDGTERLYTYQTVEGWPLMVFVGKNTSVLFRTWKKTYFIILSFIVFFTIVVVSIAYRYIQIQMEQEKNRALSMQNSKLAALGEMAAGVAHEINNPLMIISGYATRIQSLIKAGTTDTAALNVLAGKIDDSVQRIAKIIKGLKTFSRDSQGDPMLATPLASILEGIEGLTAEKFKQHAIHFEAKIEPGLQIRCREAQISQVLINLLNNSFDAILEQEQRWIELVAHKMSNGKVRITVADSGKGIPTHIREKIMNPFFTTKPVNKGTGLGLSISKGIIEDHGGRLIYDDTRKNTCFIIELPDAT